MKICLYTESFDGLDQKILGLLSKRHQITVVSSEKLTLPRTFWNLGLENPDRISGSFFIVKFDYNPAIGVYPNIRFLNFDLILCCRNVKTLEPMTEHSEDCNIPMLVFDPNEDIDLKKAFQIRNNNSGEDILFSIVTPVYNTNLKFLDECVKSVFNQIYKNFEWVIVDDGSDDEVRMSLEIYDEQYDFIKLLRFEENKGIAEALTRAIVSSIGDYICFLDSDDKIEDNCLYEISKYIDQNKDIKVLYTNEKNIDLDGSLIASVGKPDFSLELFYQIMYINHMKIIHKDIVEEVGLPNSEYSGSWDYEYFLRIAEKFKVGHLKKFLYCWRRKDAKGGFLDKGRQMIYHNHALKAIRESNERTGLIDGRIIPIEQPWRHRIERKMAVAFKVKVLILTKKNPNYLKLLLDSIEREVKYDDYEIVITQHVDEEDKDMTEFLKTVNYKVNRCDIQGFNYSKITNWQIENGYDRYTDQYVMILNDDIIFQNDCIYEMAVCMKSFDDCGIVGCKLIWPGKDFTFYGKKYTCYHENLGHIQHAGVDLYSDKCCGHRYYGFSTNWLSANYVRKSDAVTFACVLIRSRIIDQIKFDEMLPVDYQDIDFCILSKELGYETYYTPWAVALHWESVSKDGGKKEDHKIFFSKHKEYLSRFPTAETKQNEMLQGL